MITINFKQLEELNPDNQYKFLKEQSDIIGARLSELKMIIIEQYEQDPESINAIQIIPTKGRATTSWAKVAKEAKVPDSIIQKYTKVGEPGYTLKQKTAEQEKTGDGKFISA